MSTNAVVVMDLNGLLVGDKQEVVPKRDGDMQLSHISTTEFSRDEKKTQKEEAEEGTLYDHHSIENSVVLYAPKLYGCAPTERLSALCAQVGKYFLIQGGYEQGRGCLRDCLVNTIYQT